MKLEVARGIKTMKVNACVDFYPSLVTRARELGQSWMS